MKNRFIILAIILLCDWQTAFSSSVETVVGTDSIAARVARFGKALPQEKVYLHMDNTCYFLGDTLWYKGYVTRSDQSKLTNLSKILYVELLTPDGFLVERQQLEMPDGTAHGAFVLKDTLYAGYYELRAYTRWMLNFGRYEHPHSKYTEEMFYDKQMAKDFFRDYDKLYSRVFPVYNKPEEVGHFPKNMTVRPMQRYYKDPKKKPTLNLRFYPEGGHMIAGTTGRVAFELNDRDGQHLDAELSIQDKQGRVVTRTRTIHRGRGVFTLPDITAEGGYKAVFRYREYDYKVDLPQPEEYGYALTITQDEQNLVVQIKGRPDEKASTEKLALQIMQSGITQAYQTVEPDGTHAAIVRIPLSQLKTGVNQITLFNDCGRIYADRLVFVNHHDYDTPQISLSPLKKQYEPFEPIDLKLQLNTSEVPQANVSIAVRDRSTEEQTYDNGTMLTEMLLGSELKGFVETPGYYFEASDSVHTQALDLLMMVQGWRRYDWKEMAGLGSGTSDFFFPEQEQTIAGRVNKTYSLFPEVDPEDPYAYEDVLGKDWKVTTTLASPIWNLQRLYGTYIKKMRKEVEVLASFVQGTEVIDLVQPTTEGKFYMGTPKIYDECIMFLGASDTTRSKKYLERKMTKNFLNEEAYPDYYVKLDLFYPVFAKPYNYYQDAILEENFITGKGESHTESFDNRLMAPVTVRSKRGGIRKLDPNKPALVVDAYEAFNLAADYGMNCGMHDWRTFSRQVATAYFGDMGMDARYPVYTSYDGKRLSLKGGEAMVVHNPSATTTRIANAPAAITAMTEHQRKRYRRLRHLDKLYIYTDYIPREQGSWQYKSSNQLTVHIDYRQIPNEGQQYTYRDRRYIMKGYSVCGDFYSPDYSRKPLPQTQDYRRTLYWSPDVKFNEQGEALVRLYNNCKASSVSVDIEGITSEGKPVVLKARHADTPQL